MDIRKEPRTNRDSSIKYRTLQSDAYKEGILVNRGVNSALLWLKEVLVIGSYLELLAGSHDKPEHVQICVVRTEETDREGYTGYGCKVEMIVSETV